MNPCDICITEECKGKRCCNCSECSRKNVCYKILNPIIRITTNCTQSCNHCCFECSPTANKYMSISSARQISNFLKNNEISKCSIMGGEFFCHPEWQEIFDLIFPNIEYCRLVTNGDWAKDEDFIKKLLNYKEKLRISISEDVWHSNKYTRKAIEQCDENGFDWNIPTFEMNSNDVLVPVGRSKWESISFYGMFSCYCHNPEKQYSFLIDEDGVIYKCGFGIWDYADVKTFENGGFAKEFKAFNQKFYSIFISNCRVCRNAYVKSKDD